MGAPGRFSCQYVIKPLRQGKRKLVAVSFCDQISSLRGERTLQVEADEDDDDEEKSADDDAGAIPIL